MKNHQYLTEGLLESYLLGVLSKEDRYEAEQLIQHDPEIADQVMELEINMEAYFQENAVPPPPHVLVALQERLTKTEILKWEEKGQSQMPPRPEPARSPYVDVEVSDTHLRVHKYWRPAFIAIFVLSKIFLIFGLYQYFKANSLEQEILRLKATPQTVAPMQPAQLR